MEKFEHIIKDLTTNKFERIFIAFFEKPKTISDVKEETGITRATILKYIKNLNKYIEIIDQFEKGKLRFIKNSFIIDYFNNEFEETNYPLTNDEKKLFLEILNDPFFDEYLRSNNKSFLMIINKVLKFFSNVYSKKNNLRFFFGLGLLNFHLNKMSTKKKKMDSTEIKNIEKKYDDFIKRIPDSMAEKFIYLHPFEINLSTLKNIKEIYKKFE